MMPKGLNKEQEEAYLCKLSSLIKLSYQRAIVKFVQNQNPISNCNRSPSANRLTYFLTSLLPLARGFGKKPIKESANVLSKRRNLICLFEMPFIISDLSPPNSWAFRPLTRSFLVQLKIEDASRRLRCGDMGIPLNPEERLEFQVCWSLV